MADNVKKPAEYRRHHCRAHAEKRVAEWNERFPVGSMVEVLGNQSRGITVTRSTAFVGEQGEPVVFLARYTGYHSLDFLRPFECDCETAEPSGVDVTMILPESLAPSPPSPIYGSPPGEIERRLDVLRDALSGIRGADQQRIGRVGLEWITMILHKNTDYGSSVWHAPVLAPECQTEAAIRVRMSDKIARLTRLLSGDAAQCAESIEDTVRDLGAYCLLWLARPRDAEGCTTEDAEVRGGKNHE
jgi:hypothetical protein